jgi:endonuclease/exonuclease/phosphatase family metal-dependent hydrolase
VAFDPLEPYGPLIDTRARVVTWNVWANSGPWELRYARIEQLLRGMDADIVGMQEVFRAVGYEPVAEIAQKVGLTYTPCIEWFEPAQLESGTAVLSRWPVSDTGSHKLAGFDGGDGGLVQFVRVDGPRGHIDVFVVMLDWRPDLSHVRQAQVRELAAYVNDTGSAAHPVVILGDFNAGPDSDEMRTLVGQSQTAVPGLVFYDAWDVASEGGGPGHTFSRRNRHAAAALLPDRRIDYVLSAWPRARGAGHPVRCEVLGTAGLDGVDPSDHFAVMAEIRY